MAAERNVIAPLMPKQYTLKGINCLIVVIMNERKMKMLETLDATKWETAVLEDKELKTLIGKYSFRFLIKNGVNNCLWSVEKEQISMQEQYTIDDVWDFTIVIPENAWKLFISPTPPAFHNTLQAMIANVPGVGIEGNRLIWAQSIRIVERILYLARQQELSKPQLSEDEFSPETINGHYLNLNVNGERFVTYYEEAGHGHPIIFLHTAGSDSRQYKYLLGNKRLQEKWHMFAFDLPYHGKSSPPDQWWDKKYQLTTNIYTDWILAFMEAADLYDKKPVISGSSMGGAIVLHLAANYGELFKGVVSLEGGFGRHGRKVSWTNHPQVHAGHFLSSWVDGLMAPDSPEYYRRLVLWEYSQGGPGVYQGDTYFYSHDFPEATKNIGKAKCPLWILTGEYDYSCTPEMSKAAADCLGGTFIQMDGMGHFPMSENPKDFSKYFLPVLEEISKM
jgi:pimeloyl-ACP methyl ester carboxylesterase